MKQRRQNTNCQREGLRGGRAHVFPCWSQISLIRVGSSHADICPWNKCKWGHWDYRKICGTQKLSSITFHTTFHSFWGKNIMTAYFALLQSTGHRKLLFYLYIKSRYYVCSIYSVKTYVAQHNYLLVYASNVTSVSLPQESILFLILLTIKPMQNDKFPVEEHAVTQITDLFSRWKSGPWTSSL